jgi:rare lipoprotein A
MTVTAAARLVRSIVMAALALVALAGCSSSPAPPGVYKLGQPYQVDGRWYYPEYAPDYDRIGIASWYGEPFHGRVTANGEVFDRGVATAAHPTLPLPSLVRVVNLGNRRELTVRVNDRGPFVGDRIIDLSQEAARQLGFERQGTTRVRVQFIRLADARGDPPRPTLRHARAPAPGSGVDARRPALPAVAPAPAPVAASAVAQCRGEFIQVGAFAEPARAQRVAAEMHALQAMPVSLLTPARDRLARVRLGPIADPAAASAALDRLKRSGFAEAYIVAPAEPPPASC